MNNVFNINEFLDICSKFKVEPVTYDITINYNTNKYFNKIKESVEKNRRGEVVFCVLRPNGKIITVTSREYPKGIFRIPTGGIGYSENIVDAVYREVKEELGLDVTINKFAGVLKIKFEFKDASVMFYSYIFILNEVGGRLLVDAIDDEVSEVKEVDLDGLKEVADSLANIEGRWKDWGVFRYTTTHAVINVLSAHM